MKSLRFLSLIVLCLFGLIFISCSNENSPESTMNASVDLPELPSLKDKKVLIVYGGWDGHKPEVFKEVMYEMLEKEGAQIIISDSLGIYADEELMNSLDLIIQSVTMSKIKPAEIKGLIKAVKDGVGFAGAHGGFCDAFRDNTEYQYMTGAQFVSHPGGQIDFKVNIKDSTDPVVASIKDFMTHTEQYYLHIDPNVKVLATTTFDGKYDDWIKGGTMPVVWKKYHGKGRIFCITLGHDPEEFRQEEPKTILMNGIKWASASKYAPYEDWLNPVY